MSYSSIRRQIRFDDKLRSTKRLFGEVMKHACLWDPKNKDYKCEEIKMQAWEEIAKTIHPDWEIYSEKSKELTISNLKKKYTTLNKVYKREKKRGNIRAVRYYRPDLYDLSTGPVKIQDYIEHQLMLMSVMRPQVRYEASLEDLLQKCPDDEPVVKRRHITDEPQVAKEPTPYQYAHCAFDVSNLTTTADKKFEYFENQLMLKRSKHPNVQFLASLLPDMRKMSSANKIHFQLETLKLVKKLRSHSAGRNSSERNTDMVVDQTPPSPIASPGPGDEQFFETSTELCTDMAVDQTPPVAIPEQGDEQFFDTSTELCTISSDDIPADRSPTVAVLEQARSCQIN